MRRARFLACLPGAALSFLCLQAGAAMDALEAARQQAGAAPAPSTGSALRVHWEPVDGPPYLVSSQSVPVEKRVGARRFVLDATGEILFHLPAHGLLRIIADGDGPVVMPLFSISDGNGAATHVAVQAAQQDGWLLRSSLARPALVRLTGNPNAGAPQHLKFFIGIPDLPAQPVLYPSEVTLPGPMVLVRRASEPAARPWTRLAPSEERSVTVDGPVRVALEYQLDGGTAVGAISNTRLVLEAAVDDQAPRTIEQLTGPDTSSPRLVGNEWGPGVRVEYFNIDIPPGRHVVRFTSSHSILARAASNDGAEFLLPHVNMPPEWQNAAPADELAAQEQRLLAAAASNAWQEAGLAAARRMQGKADANPQVPALQTAADELEQQYGVYRDLAPVSVPDGSTASSHAYFFQTAQPPDAPPRHEITHADTPPSTLPVADFYALGTLGMSAKVGPLSFNLPDAGQTRRLRLLIASPDNVRSQIEVHYDNGDTVLLDVGIPKLEAARLRPVSLDTAAALSANAGLPGTAPAQQVSTVEWLGPANARTVQLWLVNKGLTDSQASPLVVALQEQRSIEYRLDDGFLAALARNRAASSAANVLVQDALRPFMRRLDDARAQYVADVAPLNEDAPAPDERRALQATKAIQHAEAAEREHDFVRALELWSEAKQSGDAATRAKALHGQARALFASGERYVVERLLRGHWTGKDPAVVQAAAEELRSLYKREGDLAMQALFAAARASTDKDAYPDLARIFAAQGNDELALLAGLLVPSAEARDLPLLMQSALRGGRWQTFDALLTQLGEERERAYWQMQREVALGRTEQALRLAQAHGWQDWAQALYDAGRLASSLASSSAPDVRGKAVADWLAWQQNHPGPRLWTLEPGLVRRHAGGAVLRSVGLDLATTWYHAQAERPLRVRVVGPARLRIEARPLHQDAASLASGYLHARAQGQHWLQPFFQNQVAPALVLDADCRLPGTAVVREIAVPSGLHDIDIDAAEVPVIARVQVERPALPVSVLARPGAAYFEDRPLLSATLLPATSCGLREGCQILADDGLQTRRTRLQSVQWHALPEPAREQDKAASLVAAGDLQSAYEASRDPVEKIGLLLWLARTNPGQRGFALAKGAELAASHPVAEVLGPWQQLEEQSAWTQLPLVDRSAGLRTIETPAGAPASPKSRLRAALLGPLQENELRLGGDNRAVLVHNLPSPATLTVDVMAEKLPGSLHSPMTLVVEHNGKRVQRIQLDAGTIRHRVALRLPAGEQLIAVSLKAPYANQFVRVKFGGMGGSGRIGETDGRTGTAGALPTLARDWHIATPQQAVEATIAGPAWVRIDRSTRTGIRSEERFVTESVHRLVLPAEPDDRETLYRVFVRRLEPMVIAPKPQRPNSYRPQPLPAPPVEWPEATRPQPAGKLRFIDARSLDALASSTWTGRFGLFRRQDADVTGDDARLPVERFAEAGLAWRQGQPDGMAFHRADVFTRHHAVGSPAAGLRYSFDSSLPWTPAWPYPLHLAASLGIVTQHALEKWGAAVSARAEVSQERRLTPMLSHRPALEWNGRATNLGAVRDSARVDSDIFTRYRKDHPWAVSVSDTLSWRAWRDNHGSVRAAIVSNPNFNLFKPDHLALDANWRQLAGSTVLEAGVRAIRFFVDEDRAVALTRRDLRLHANWERWLQDGTRLELHGEMRRNLATGEHWGGVEVRWHWGPGRGYRDFSVNEIHFRSLRSWRAPSDGTLVEEP